MNSERNRSTTLAAHAKADTGLANLTPAPTTTNTMDNIPTDAQSNITGLGIPQADGGAMVSIDSTYSDLGILSASSPTNRIISISDSYSPSLPHSPAREPPLERSLVAMVESAQTTSSISPATDSAPITAQTGPLTEFTLFPLLPTELRLKIFGKMMPGPRVIEVFYRRAVDPASVDPADRDRFYTDSGVPVVLHLNFESRSEALKELVKMVNTPLRGMDLRPFGTYINFGLDMLLLPMCSDFALRDSHGGATFRRFWKSFNHSLIAQIQHLSVDILNFQPVIFNLPTTLNPRDLNLVISDDCAMSTDTLLFMESGYITPTLQIPPHKKAIAFHRRPERPMLRLPVEMRRLDLCPNMELRTEAYCTRWDMSMINSYLNKRGKSGGLDISSVEFIDIIRDA